jgi:hypothetical protein
MCEEIHVQQNSPSLLWVGIYESQMNPVSAWLLPKALKRKSFSLLGASGSVILAQTLFACQ